MRPLAGKVAALFRPYRKQIGFLVLAILVSSLLGLVPPLIIARIVDSAILEGDRGELDLLVIIMVVAVVASSLVGVAQGYLNNRIGQGVMYDLRKRLYGRLQRQSVRFFISTKSGEILSRLTNDVGGVQDAVTNTFTNVLANLITAGTTIALLFIFDWRLALISLSFLPFFVYPTKKVGGIQRRLAGETQARLGDLSASAQETLSFSGAILTRSFGRQDFEAERFDAHNRQVRDLSIRRAIVGRWFFMLFGLFGSLTPAVVYWFGGRQVMSGDMSVGEVIAFVALLGRLLGPITSLMGVQVTFFSSFALFERVFEYADLPIEIEDRPGAIDIGQAEGRVAFEDVTFAYRDGRPVLQDIDLRVEPGQLAALVGPSGAGKTTVTYLLLRLYDPEQGRVTLDGVDLREIKLDSLAAQVGMVPQEPYLFHATLMENIRYARLEATDEEVHAAARAAEIHEFIEGLPRGYDTVVGERGYRLSGGEKQRVAIARAILKDPRILILDEATSSLDSHTERQIQRAMARLVRDRTSLVIAHRLSTVQAADVIFVLEQGRIVERGTHTELLARGGLYADLYREQFAPGAELALPAPA